MGAMGGLQKSLAPGGSRAAEVINADGAIPSLLGSLTMLVLWLLGR